MLKSSRYWLAITFVITFGAIGCATLAMNWVIHNAPTQQQAEQKAKTQSEIKATEILTSERVAYYTEVLAFITGLLASFAAFQILFVIKADRTAWIAANAAKDSADALKAQERAYLFVSVKLKEPILVTTANTKNFGKMIIVNHGKTPAILKRLNGLIETYSAFPEREYTEIQLDIPAGVQVIGPGRDESFDLEFFLNQDKWNSITSGQAMLLAVGRVQYEVVYGEKHETGFCWAYQDRLKDFYPADSHELNYRD